MFVQFFSLHNIFGITMGSYFIFTGKVQDVTKVQTLLFSATLPSWVKQVCVYMNFVQYLLFGLSLGCYLFEILCCQISTKFLKADKKTADLVGNEKMKASTNVRHIILPCNSTARAQLIPDIIRCYSR